MCHACNRVFHYFVHNIRYECTYHTSAKSLRWQWRVANDFVAFCSLKDYFIMAALWIGIGQAIMLSSCGFFFHILSFFFLLLFYSQPSQIGYLPYFHTWCGLSANLECMSEMCCMRFAVNTVRKNSPKIRHLGTIAQLCRAISSQLRNVSTIGKKHLLNSNISSTRPHIMANFGPLTAEIGSGVWGTPENFNGFRVLPSLRQRRRSPEANQTLHNVWPSPALVHCIYIFGGSCRLTEFCQVQCSITSKSCVLLNWQSYCTTLQQRGSAKLCGVVHGMELRNFHRGRHLYLAGCFLFKGFIFVCLLTSLKFQSGYPQSRIGSFHGPPA